MSDQTITDEPIEEQAQEVQTAQPEETIDDSAVETTEPSEEVTTQEDTSTTEDTQVEEDLDEWATKAGYDTPTTDMERKLLQEKRDSNREFTKTRQAEKKSITEMADEGQEPQQNYQDQNGNYVDVGARRELSKMRVDSIESNFYSDPKTAEMRDDIEAEIQSNPVLMEMAQASLNVDPAYAQQALNLAKAAVVAKNFDGMSADLEKKGRTDGLNDLQDKQRVTPVKGNATNHSQNKPLTASNADEWYTSLTPAQRKDRANQATYRKALNS